MSTESANNLTVDQFATLLEKLDACQEARDWAKGKDLATAWTSCHQGDWLLWLLDHAAPLNPITNELLVCRFAREVQHVNPDPRVLACIETREAWARGEVSDEVRAAARDAAEDAIHDAIGDGAEAAAWAAVEPLARDAALCFIEAATLSLTRADAWATGWAIARAKQADIIRELLPMPVLA